MILKNYLKGGVMILKKGGSMILKKSWLWWGHVSEKSQSYSPDCLAVDERRDFGSLYFNISDSYEVAWIIAASEGSYPNPHCPSALYKAPQISNSLNQIYASKTSLSRKMG